MDKKTKIYVLAFVLLILGYLYLESTKKQPINWFPSYASKHKIPYGTYVLRTELEMMFPDTEIRDVRISPYVKLKDTTVKGTYLFINNVYSNGFVLITLPKIILDLNDLSYIYYFN